MPVVAIHFKNKDLFFFFFFFFPQDPHMIVILLSLSVTRKNTWQKATMNLVTHISISLITEASTHICKTVNMSMTLFIHSTEGVFGSFLYYERDALHKEKGIFHSKRWEKYSGTHEA
jgi:hypothetical protein